MRGCIERIALRYTHHPHSIRSSPAAVSPSWFPQRRVTFPVAGGNALRHSPSAQLDSHTPVHVRGAPILRSKQSGQQRGSPVTGSELGRQQLHRSGRHFRSHSFRLRARAGALYPALMDTVGSYNCVKRHHGAHCT
ncbi:hypothetical protein NDU88_003010 [Pleurodeles waltl]|uniref:Uncharacterized protein n=1 Tax=Pleurodeles waltl TaxID=8319 RepID=A0AAV7UEX0_PLEWA|nr:hypothetical protein NDU88_003010 [Pleurodeles waltl]